MKTHSPLPFIREFSSLSIADIPEVGGKTASLGEMFVQMADKGIAVPDGFAITASAYRFFIHENGFSAPMHRILESLDRIHYSNLHSVSAQLKSLLKSGRIPAELQNNILEAYHQLSRQAGIDELSVAARSSATAEDLPNASFAGMQETFLNVKGDADLLDAVRDCFASLFTERAIHYRETQQFGHEKVALTVAVQRMVRSDLACSGVIFTLDPDSGFRNAILISGAWGLGENVVQGAVNPDEFLVFKPGLESGKYPILQKKKGSKSLRMVFGKEGNRTENQPVSEADASRFVLDDAGTTRLADWALKIERHYGRPMDIEWAKDGITGDLFIVQARPETVHSQKKTGIHIEFKLIRKGPELCSGIGLGNRIVTGKARILHSPEEGDALQPGEILVTHRTDPDWDPLLKKAGAIVTNEGGRTSHAAIVAREVGALAVVGTGDATQKISNGQVVTVFASGNEPGRVFEGEATWEETETDLGKITLPKANPMLILGDPDQAFSLSFLPQRGVGLLRMEFIINHSIRIHPMALVNFDKLQDAEAKKEIAALTRDYEDKSQYFVDTLAASVSVIAAAFWPNPVIVRMSDFKSNEYANLIGGTAFEPDEENPMIGFRGALRYYHEKYREGFALECRAMKKLREEMGFSNVKLMIPFCRTPEEGRKVLDIMAQQGLKRGENGLEVYVMAEIPSNIILAEEFAKLFDGFSIGSNDLTQLCLGVDRDSGMLSSLYSAEDPAVMAMIRTLLEKARLSHTHVGLCGQAASDFPEYARFLIENGIDSISFTPDALLRGIANMNAAEKALR